MNLQKNLRRARLRGLVVVRPKENELQVDIDSHTSLRHYGWHYRMLMEAGLTRGWRPRIVTSKTKGHAHITIRLPRPMPLLERILLQSILRSDPHRETFNYIRAKKGSRTPIAFFEKEK